MSPPSWRWDNVPLPEAHLAALGGAILAHLILPVRLPLGGRTRVLGWGAILAGSALAADGVWSASAEGVSVDRPARLVTTGAFAVGRNPMYQGWSTAVAGLGLATRSPWILAAAILGAAAAHRAIGEEEAVLSRDFGPSFAAYSASTPRYASGPAAIRRVGSMIRALPVFGGGT